MKVEYNLEEDDQFEDMIPQKDLNRIKKKVRTEKRKETYRRIRHNRIQEERDEIKNKKNGP